MATVDEQKFEIFTKIWEEFKGIKDTLLLAGIKEDRLPDYGKCELKLGDAHINKIRHAAEWMKEFIRTKIVPWRKLRAENPEHYWLNAKYMGLGNDVVEIKHMNELSKSIRKEWFHQHNMLTNKKPKEEEEKK